MKEFLGFMRSWKGFAGAALLAFFLLTSWGCGPSGARQGGNAKARANKPLPASFAPSHRRPMIEREGKTLLWAKGDPRSEATWEAALDRLEELGLVRAEGYKRAIFKVTDAGYKVADVIGPNGG